MTTTKAPVQNRMRTIFRIAAIAEAVSWAGLLAAMFAKYVLESEPLGLHEGGVPVFGLIHGIVFVIYVAVSVIAWVIFRWTWKVTLLALVSAVPPFTTVVFERIADRKGLLGRSL